MEHAALTSWATNENQQPTSSSFYPAINQASKRLDAHSKQDDPDGAAEDDHRHP